MLSLILIILIGAWVIYQPQTVGEVVGDLPIKVSEKLTQLWDIAQDSLQTKRYLRAEKALLTILRIDEKNAIECFEIAQSLEPNASSLHNVGLIYYETKQYDKAALAFEQALAIDKNLPSRHIAYAKVQEKLGHDKKMIESLEKAVELEPIPQTLNILADAYERTGQLDLATKLRDKAAKMLLSQGRTPRRVKQPRRVVM